jgi:3D (Asp-Asp-Asp) domain-containing protein
MIHNGEYLPMDKLIMKELKAFNILSSRNVLDFKKYISFKYAKSTSKEKADILADAIRKTIDERIPKVEKALKTNLIDNIIKNSIQQGSFDINSEDILIECLNLKCNMKEDTFLSALCSWINEVTVINIEKENMKKFINSIYSLEVKVYDSESISTVLKNINEEKYDNSSVIDISNDISNDILDNDISNDILDNDISNDILDNDISNVISDNDFSDVISDNDFSDLYFDEIEFEKYDQNLVKKATAELVMDNVIGKYPRSIQIQWINKIFIRITNFVQKSIKTLPESKLVIINKMKCLRIKDIAIGMSLIMLVLLLIINTIQNNFITDKNTNNMSTENDRQSNVQDILTDKSKSLDLPDIMTSRGWEKLIMEATAYDLSIESCGKARTHPLYGITSTGTKATTGRTVAVDPTVIPMGSKLYIKFPKSYSNLDGIYFAEDTGSKVKGKIIDIFLGEDKPGESIVHKKADNFGRRRVEVSIIK